MHPVLLAFFVGGATFVAASGAALVAFGAKKMPRKVLDTLLGVAAGIMLAATIGLFEEVGAEAALHNLPLPLVLAVGLTVGTGVLLALDLLLMHRFRGVDHHSAAIPPSPSPQPASLAPATDAAAAAATSSASSSSVEVSLERRDLVEVVPQPQQSPDESSAVLRQRKRKTAAILLVSAMALHTLPEGLALGLICSTASQSPAVGSSSSSADAGGGGGGTTKGLGAVVGLTLGLALHTIPESAAVVMPLRQCGISARLSFLICSGVAALRLVMALVGAAIAVGGFIPFGLAAAAAAMLYVITDDIIPMSHESGTKHLATLGTMGGLIGMLVLMSTLELLLL